MAYRLQNVMVSSRDLHEVKVADYGLIRLAYKQSSLRRMLTPDVGSKSYKAAEVAAGKFPGGIRYCNL